MREIELVAAIDRMLGRFAPRDIHFCSPFEQSLEPVADGCVAAGKQTVCIDSMDPAAFMAAMITVVDLLK
jgi:hypothetical protein